MITKLLPDDSLILCAVSGGADSLYLLCRLQELGYPVAAAHFHHGLRGGAADRDEAFVRTFCEERGIPFRAGHGDTAAYASRQHLSLEDAARTLRYAFLETAADALGAAVIATAHTADDNAETVLMHLTRGAGPAGLSGIPPVRGRIVRPLLDETHEQALSYLDAHALPHTEDETNLSDFCFRNRIRHHVIPVLREENPGFARTVLRTTELLREDDAFLTGLARRFLDEHRRGDALPASDLAELPTPVSLRVIRLMAGPGLSLRHAQAVLRTAAHGGYADIPGMRVGRSGGDLVFGVPEKQSYWEYPLSPGTSVILPEAGFHVRCEHREFFPEEEEVYRPFNIFLFPCTNICGNISVTAGLPGDRFRPAHRGCTKPLRRLFSEAGIPVWARSSVPVLRDEQGILGVQGIGPAERVSASPDDRDLIRIEFFREDPSYA